MDGLKNTLPYYGPILSASTVASFLISKSAMAEGEADQAPAENRVVSSVLTLLNAVEDRLGSLGTTLAALRTQVHSEEAGTRLTKLEQTVQGGGGRFCPHPESFIRLSRETMGFTGTGLKITAKHIDGVGQVR